MTSFTATVYIGDNECECTIDENYYIEECTIGGVSFIPDGLFIVVGKFPDHKTVPLEEYLVDQAQKQLDEYGGFAQIERENTIQYAIDCARGK